MAFSTKTNPTQLTIYDYAQQKIILNLAWDKDWKPCRFFWWQLMVPTLPTDHLVLVSEVNDKPVFLLNVQTGSMRRFVDIYQELPHFKTDGFYAPSPDASMFFYVQCLGKEFSYSWAPNQIECDGEENGVVYRLADHRQIVDFQDATLFVTQGGMREVYGQGVSWSPSGRYISYLSSYKVNIYDFLQKRYIQTQVELDSVRANPIWSADERFLAFWSFGTIIRFDLETQKVTSIGEAAYIMNLCQCNWTFSPDNQSIAFIDDNHSLVVTDVSTGQMTVLDKDVGESGWIIAWVASPHE